jgi:dTDP-4-amino-4,6-dideoxygalactose transaminase
MIKFADPKAQYEEYSAEIDDAISNVLKSDRYILGEEVTSLEKEFSEYIGTKHSIGVANGTDALELSLRAMDIGYGDEVITVSHTAVPTVAAIESCGASPVLIDVDQNHYTMNISHLKEALSSKTKAVIAVHIYGNACDLSEISSFCKTNDLKLIEDVSQAHGATFDEKKLGSIGDIGCFSCFPTKNLGAIGDAGLITTNNDQYAEKIIMLREYGWKERLSQIQGRNSRLDEIQAAILRVKLRHLDETNSKRVKIANLYKSKLSSVPLKLPSHNQNVSPVFHLFVAQTDKRDELLKFLSQREIFAGIHYPVPVHLQPAYLNRVKILDLAVTEEIAGKIISLPLYPELSKEKVEDTIDCIKSFFSNES